MSNKLYWRHFATAIAAFSAAATLLTVLFDLEFIKTCWGYGALGLVIVLSGSFVFSCWQIRSKKKIEMDLSNQLHLTIQESDLFDQRGVICIPFNEFFDTHVGDGVVGKDTIHGRFINKFFFDRIPELNQKISIALTQRGDQIKDSQVDHRRIDGCPCQKYKLGTCISIREGENVYVLFALSHFDQNDKAFVQRHEYREVVRNLAQYLSSTVEGKTVYMPLMGTGLSRIDRSPQRILLHLVDILDFDDTCKVPGGLHIVIKSLSSLRVNLNAVEQIIKQGITESDTN